MAHRDVERLGRDILLRPIRHRALDSGGNRLDDGRMEQLCLSGMRELVGQRLRLLGCDVETEDFDRDQAIARRLVGAEHRTECAHADLMQDPEGAKRRRRSECGRIVSGQ